MSDLAAYPYVPPELERVAAGNGLQQRRDSTAKPAKLRRLDVARMIREQPAPPPWVVENLVVRGMLTVLHGREGQGKSLLAQALAAGVASGQDEAGLVCRKGRVVIVDAENGEYEIHRRVHALGLPSEDIEVFEVASDFDLRSDLLELERVLGEHRPDLLVLDSFRSLWGGKENDSGEVAAALDPLRNLIRRHNAGTLLLHHSGRGVEGTYRGSSAIGASCELGFGLHRAEDDEDDSRRYLATWKCRPAPEPPRRWLRLAVERGRVFIDVAEPVDADAEKQATTAPVREELAPKVLAALSINAPRTRADVARAVERGPKDRSVGRVLDELADEGAATRRDDGQWVRVAGAAGPIGRRHPATPGDNPRGNGQNGGGRPPATLDGSATPSERPASPAEEAEAERLLSRWRAAI